MSATFDSNAVVTGNVLVQGTGTLYAAVNVAYGNVLTTYGSFSLATAIGADNYSYTTAMVMNDGTVRMCGRNLEGQLGLNDTINRSTVVTVIGISQAIAVSCGGFHTLFLMNDGTVRGCGQNSEGELGQNDLVLTKSTVVTILGISSQAIAVAAGLVHTVILMNDGTVRGCGRNDQGQLGINNTATRSTLVTMIGISSQAVAIGVGTLHTLVVMNDGTVRGTGYNFYGQLGLNDRFNRLAPTQIPGVSQAIAAAGGLGFSLLLMKDGTVLSCGRNDRGQLGVGDTATRSNFVSVLGISTAIGIAASLYHSVFLLKDGTVWACGGGGTGRLGNNSSANKSTVVPVLGISSQAISVACGVRNTTILLNDGTVLKTGENTDGRLGQDDTTQRNTPVPILYITSIGQTISLLEQNPISQLWTSSMGYITALVMSDGTIRVCGRNEAGQLGQNDVVTRSTVVSVLGISSQAVSVAFSRVHTLILMNDGTVRVCGRNDRGQLGQNDLVTRSTVVSVLGISSQAIGVACGFYHTAILMNDGTVRVCGDNSSGQLGQNDTANRSTVVSILGISSQAIAVACGRYHTAILMNDGTVRVCGVNNNGQLGLNDLTTRSTVVSILGISSQAIAVACGQDHTVILMNNGTVRVCGNNTHGQLGQNNVLTRSTVVSVLGISSQAVGIASGLSFISILMNDGTVRVCGVNNNGQLGLNDLTTRSTVVSILGISSQAIGIACGSTYTAILMSDGTVRICGRNNFGQLGQNNTAVRSTVVPITIGMPTNAILIAPALNLGPVASQTYQLELNTDNARKLTTTTWTTGSDEALKTDIVTADLERCVEIVSKLDLKYFKWEIPSDDKHSLGWIAQEVEQFFPKAVQTNEAHGISDFKNLNSDQLIKVMWGALKKLRADLKAKQTS